MTESLRFRPAELDDLEALVDLEQRCFDSDRISRRSFRHLLTRGHTVCLVAESRGHLAGYGLLLLSRGTSAARLYSLAVDPGCRGKGIGGRLLTALEEAARDAECGEIRLEVRPDNLSAIGLYQKLGYRPFGSVADYYEDHGDALRFRKSLAPELGLDMVRVPFYAQTLDFTCGASALLMAMGALRPELTLDRRLELRLWREATTIFMTSGHGGCGPHGLALAALHRGFRVRVFVSKPGPLLLDSVRSPTKKDVMRLVHQDMEQELRAKGVPIHLGTLKPENLEREFRAGAIPLVLISSYRIYGQKFPHWVVMTGCDDRYIYVHDPFVDEEKGESLADCINMPILKREFAAMSRYGRANQRAVVILSNPDSANSTPESERND